jgi:ATP-dependent Clp protease, protease subunit
MVKNREGLDFLEIPMELSNLDPISYQYFDKLLNKRTIIFNEGVDTDILENVILPLKDFEEDDSEEPVTLILQTIGGQVSDGLPVINVIDNYKKKLNIIVYGYAYSMGFAILCAGSKNKNVTKKCYGFTTALWHSGSVILAGDASVVNDVQEFNKQMDNVLKEYIIENTLIPRELYEKKERYQFYFTANELLKYGIVDEIIGEAKEPELCKSCLLRGECENRVDYSYEMAAEDFSCEDMEPYVC